MTTLILIRHGQSEANLQGVFAGNLDAKLVELGYKQAERTAQYIKENYKVDAVYASDLIRAYETGRCIADALGLPVKPDKNLREIVAGKWEGVIFEDIVALYPEEYSVWMNDIGNAKCPGGETVKELSDRIFTALTRIAEENPGKTVVIATHATPVRVTQCIIEKPSLEEMKNIPWVSNASVTEISYEKGNWKIVKVGEDSHLSDLKTSLPANV